MVYPHSYKRDELKKTGIIRIADHASLFALGFDYSKSLAVKANERSRQSEVSIRFKGGGYHSQKIYLDYSWCQFPHSVVGKYNLLHC